MADEEWGPPPQEAREEEEEDQDRTDGPSSPSRVEVDYYGVLNVSREATEDEIKTAYKKLCLTYHPDRHREEADQEFATRKFTEFTEAYEVLMDPQRRAVYDSFGHEGLRTGLELGARLKTPEEIKREFERLREKREQKRVAAHVNFQGGFDMGVDATSLLEGDTLQDDTTPQINYIKLFQSFHIPFSRADRVVLSGAVGNSSGRGGGSTQLGYRRQYSSKGFCEFVSFLAHGNRTFGGMLFRSGRQLSLQSYATLEVKYQASQVGIGAVLNRQLWPHTIGSIRWDVGQLGVGTTLTTRTQTELNEIGVDVTVPSPGRPPFAGCHWVHRLSRRSGMELGFTVNPLMKEVEIEWGGTRRMSGNSRLGMFVVCGIQSGIMWRFRFDRSGQKVHVPIKLSSILDPFLVLFATIVPVTIISLLRSLLWGPHEKLRERRKKEESRQRNAELLNLMKKEAEAAVRLMETTVTRKRAQEESVRGGGLIIVHARYGSLDEPVGSFDPDLPPFIDVTIAVQYQVERSKLILNPTSKSALPGFYDPCPGESKQLYIKYLFKGRPHAVTADDLDAVVCPQEGDMIV